MKIGHTIDSNGFWTGDVLNDSDETPDVSVICPDGFYKAHWNGVQWGEWLTQAEIDAIRNVPQLPTEMDMIGQQLVEKDIQIMQLQTDNDVIGQQVVDLDIRLMMGGL